MDIITTPVQEITLDSEQIVHETAVDLITRGIPDAVHLTQYEDSLPIIAVSLKRSGEAYALPSGAACNIRVQKQDGTTDYEAAYGCDSTRTVVYFEVTDDMTDVAGELETTLEVVVSGDIAGTSPLNILIEENPVSVAALGASRSAPAQLRNSNIEPITTAVEEITISSERIIHVTEADMVTRRVPKTVRLVQYDTTLPVLAVTLSNYDVVYALPSGASCNIRLKKPDGTVVYNPAYGCDSTRSVVYFEVTGQMSAVFGELKTVLEIIVSGKVAYTSPLRIIVEENPVKDDDYESEDEIQAIIALVAEAEAARDEAVEAAEGVADDAEAAASSASDAAASATAASGSASAAAGSASAAAGSATQAGTYAGNASASATAAAGSASDASGSATAAAASATQAAASAATLDAPKILGNFATYEPTTTASKAYAVGERLTHNGYLYRVTTAIAQGGTITPNTNCVQTTVEKEIENRRLWFKNVIVNALNGSIIDLQNSIITADYILEGNSITWGDSSKITEVTGWSTDTAGHFIVTGTASAATTATFSLVKADKRIENNS